MSVATPEALHSGVSRCNVAAMGSGAVALSGAVLVATASDGAGALDLALLALGLVGLLTAVLVRRPRVALIEEHHKTVAHLESLTRSRSSDEITAGLRELGERHEDGGFIQEEIARRLPAIQSHLARVRAQEETERDAEALARRRSSLAAIFSQAGQEIRARTDRLREASAPFVAGRRLDEAIATLVGTRDHVQAKWEAAQLRMTWWQHLTVDPPDFAKLDEDLAKLRAARSRLDRKGDLKKVRIALEEVALRATRRLDALRDMALKAVPASHRTPLDETSLARSALWLSALSVPVSVWGDLSRAGDVYEALRRANGQLAGLSDSEIWLHALTLPAESLAGLVSLTKGAYFEQLVANATGGTLHATFNTPNTDIVIDGVAYQIKATDSEAYLATVPEDIPIIATSEVAEMTNALDVGISHADVESATELALGGTIIDLGDTAADALLTGVGGLGLLATLRGINHAAARIKAGEDAELAVLEGLGVAVKGTAKAFVDTAELGYKIVTSRPSRFLGRQLHKVATRIDRAIVGDQGPDDGKSATPAKGGDDPQARANQLKKSPLRR